MILKFSLVGKSPGRVCRVDVEGDVVRREYGHARRRCHGLRGKRFTVSRPRFFRPLLSSCFLGESGVKGKILNVVVKEEEYMRTQEIMYIGMHATTPSRGHFK